MRYYSSGICTESLWYGMKLNNQFFFFQYRIYLTKQNKAFFVGTDKGRYAQLVLFADLLKKYYNIEADFHIIDKNKKGKSDGTNEFLYEWQKSIASFEKIDITLDKNYGGSGGFYEGMKATQKEQFDWLWISDDDAYPEPHAFEIINVSMEKNPNYDVICSSVITAEGIDTGHRKVIKNSNNIFGVPIKESEYSIEKC